MEACNFSLETTKEWKKNRNTFSWKKPENWNSFPKSKRIIQIYAEKTAFQDFTQATEPRKKALES